MWDICTHQTFPCQCGNITCGAVNTQHPCCLSLMTTVPMMDEMRMAMQNILSALLARLAQEVVHLLRLAMMALPVDIIRFIKIFATKLGRTDVGMCVLIEAIRTVNVGIKC